MPPVSGLANAASRLSGSVVGDGDAVGLGVAVCAPSPSGAPAAGGDGWSGPAEMTGGVMGWVHPENRAVSPTTGCR